MHGLVDCYQRETKERVLELVPQKPPFRFIDKIVDLTDEGIVGSYRFRREEWFYQGHFPSRPITPGVILLEAMAQTGIVAFGLYLALRENGNLFSATPQAYLTLFSDATVEFFKVVDPGMNVFIKGEKIYFRRQKLAANVSMLSESGELIAKAKLSGIGVKESHKIYEQ